MAKVTLQSIATALSTSVVTVSNALSGKPGVSDELREKIVKTAFEMGYRALNPALYQAISGAPSVSVNSNAHNIGENAGSSLHAHAAAMEEGFNTKRYHNLAVVCLERYLKVGNSFYWELYKNAAVVASRQDYSTSLNILSDEDVDNLVISRPLLSDSYDGIIMIGPFPLRYIEKVKALQKQVVLLDYFDEIEDVVSVTSHNYMNSYKATRYLIDKGHQQIGFVGNKRLFSNITERYYGFERAMIEAGLEVQKKWIYDDRDEKSGLCFEKIQFPFAVDSPKHDIPTALVCNCDIAAWHAKESIEEIGFSIPDDISLIGYDNFLEGKSFLEKLTTVDVDLMNMAEIGVKLLMDEINHIKPRTKLIRLEGKIIERHSVRPYHN